MVEQMREAAQAWWRKVTDPAFLWAVLGAVVLYVWNASAERERVALALADHGSRIARLEQEQQRDRTETATRLVSEAAERADIKASLLALRDIIQRVEAQQREFMERTTRLIEAAKQQRG